MKIEFTKEEVNALLAEAIKRIVPIPDGFQIKDVGEPTYLYGTVTVQLERVVPICPTQEATDGEETGAA